MSMFDNRTESVDAKSELPRTKPDLLKAEQEHFDANF